MSHVCNVCGGKGWVWTGAARVLCRGCEGTGRPRPAEDHAKGPMPRVEDPALQRSSAELVRQGIAELLARLPVDVEVLP